MTRKSRQYYQPGKVYVEDIRCKRLWFCVDFMKWFDRNGLDYKEFIRNGIEAEKLLATGDRMAEMAVESAMQRERETS